MTAGMGRRAVGKRKSYLQQMCLNWQEMVHRWRCIVAVLLVKWISVWKTGISLASKGAPLAFLGFVPVLRGLPSRWRDFSGWDHEPGCVGSGKILVIEAEQHFEGKTERGGSCKAGRIRKFTRSKQERACRPLCYGHACGESHGRAVDRSARQKGSGQSSTTAGVKKRTKE